MPVQRQLLSVLITVLLLLSNNIHAQDSTGLYSKVFSFPDKLFGTINSKGDKLEARLEKKAVRYLHKLSRQEKKLQKQLALKDSTAAKEIFGNTAIQYAAMEEDLKNGGGKLNKFQNVYSGHLDSMKTALGFMDAHKLLNQSPDMQAKLQETLGKMNGVQDKLNQTEAINKYLQQRQQYLKEQLGKFGLTKQLQGLQKDVYYYRAQMDAYKKTFENPADIESKLMDVLANTNIFKDFFARHSELGGLFRLPGSSSTTATATPIPGLQTRDMVMQDLQQRLGTGADVQQVMLQNMQSAQSQLSSIKEKINQIGSNGGGDADIPHYKANLQKVKSLRERIELTSNVQSVKGNNFFPTTTDLSVGLNYKLNDKSILGWAGSYKMGWGKDIRHIDISHQGFGMRSFAEYKIKGGFWASGGGEMNYRSQFSRFEVLQNYSAWQKSALVGVSKKYKISSNMNGSMQLLYDLIWRSQTPRSQPIVFRIGYRFK